MGLRFRKSFNYGGFRVNFSKTGVGCSVGVPGFRYTVTADGRERVTVSIPGTGISYVEESSAAKRADDELERAKARGDYEEIRNADIGNLVSVEYKQFITECQNWMQAWNTNKKILIGCGIAAIIDLIFMGLFSMPVSWGVVGLVIIAVFAAVVALNMNSLKSNRIKVDYSFDVSPNPYTDLQELFEKTPRSSKTWCTRSVIHNIERRKHAGAGNTVELKPFKVVERKPLFLDTNIKCYCLDFANEDFYILPDKIIIVNKDGVGAINTNSVNMTCVSTEFRENGTVPNDAVVLSYCWEKVNNNGTPDRRYKDNRQIPICRYSEITVTSPEGINLLIYTSNYDKAFKFYQMWLGMRNKVYQDKQTSAPKRNVEPQKKPEYKPAREEPISVADDAVKNDEPESKSAITHEEDGGYFSYSGTAYILNTDIKASEEHHNFMIENGVAAAYGSGYKEKIEKVNPRDLILLYQSGVGLVAYGLATENRFQNVDEDMYAIQLSDYMLFSKPMTAADLKKLTDHSFPFVQTMFSVKQEYIEIIISEIMARHV